MTREQDDGPRVLLDLGQAIGPEADFWTEAREGDHATGQTAQQPEEQTAMSDTPDFDGNRATFQPGGQDYAALRTETAARLEVSDSALPTENAAELPAQVAENRAEIGAFMGAAPGGTFIYTGQTHSPANTPTDYENGPHRPGTVLEADPFESFLSEARSGGVADPAEIMEAEIVTGPSTASTDRQTAELAVLQGTEPTGNVSRALETMDEFDSFLSSARDDYGTAATEITGREADHATSMGGRGM